MMAMPSNFVDVSNLIEYEDTISLVIDDPAMAFTSDGHMSLYHRL